MVAPLGAFTNNAPSELIMNLLLCILWCAMNVRVLVAHDYTSFEESYRTFKQENSDANSKLLILFVT